MKETSALFYSAKNYFSLLRNKTRTSECSIVSFRLRDLGLVALFELVEMFVCTVKMITVKLCFSCD